jgi:hypothetical protein
VRRLLVQVQVNDGCVHIFVLRPEQTDLVSCREHGWKTHCRLWGVLPITHEWGKVRLNFNREYTRMKHGIFQVSWTEVFVASPYTNGQSSVREPHHRECGRN